MCKTERRASIKTTNQRTKFDPLSDIQNNTNTHKLLRDQCENKGMAIHETINTCPAFTNTRLTPPPEIDAASTVHGQ